MVDIPKRTRLTSSLHWRLAQRSCRWSAIIGSIQAPGASTCIESTFTASGLLGTYRDERPCMTLHVAYTAHAVAKSSEAFSNGKNDQSFAFEITSQEDLLFDQDLRAL